MTTFAPAIRQRFFGRLMKIKREFWVFKKRKKIFSKKLVGIKKLIIFAPRKTGEVQIHIE